MLRQQLLEECAEVVLPVDEVEFQDPMSLVAEFIQLKDVGMIVHRVFVGGQRAFARGGTRSGAAVLVNRWRRLL